MQAHPKRYRASAACKYMALASDSANLWFRSRQDYGSSDTHHRDSLMFGMFRGGWKQIALLGGATLIVIVLFHQAIAQAFRGDPVFQAGGRLLAQGRQVLDSPQI